MIDQRVENNLPVSPSIEQPKQKSSVSKIKSPKRKKQQENSSTLEYSSNFTHDQQPAFTYQLPSLESITETSQFFGSHSMFQNSLYYNQSQLFHPQFQQSVFGYSIGDLNEESSNEATNFVHQSLDFGASYSQNTAFYPTNSLYYSYYQQNQPDETEFLNFYQ